MEIYKFLFSNYSTYLTPVFAPLLSSLPKHAWTIAMSMTKEEALKEYEKLRSGKMRVNGAQESGEDSDDDFVDAKDGTELPTEPKSEKPGAPQEEDAAPELDDGLSAEEAASCKEEGNKLYKSKDYAGACLQYAKAASSAHARAEERAKYLANLAAAQLAQGEYELVEKSATLCLELDSGYRKARERRLTAREALQNYRGALSDAKELGCAPGKLAQLERRAAAKEKADTEKAMGELKGLADSFLSNFGMSVNDFQANKDPNTGGYSISMNNK